MSREQVSEDVATEEKKKDKKPKTLADLQKNLTKDFGSKSVIIGDDIQDVPLLCSFGSIALDVAVGIGGIPRGRILEYFGPPSGGKTLFTLLTMIECQRKEGVVVFIDLENSFDPAWFRKLGGSTDPDHFILLRPKTGAEAYEMIDQMVASDLVDIIGVDSVSTMATAEELEGDYGDAHMAQLARLMSDSLKKLNLTMIAHPRCTVIFINQIRSGMDKYKPEVTTGGSALNFYSSVRLRIVRVGGEDGIIGDTDNPEGFRTKIKVAKNKVGPPFRTIETSIYVNHPTKCGVDINEELLDVAISMNLIQRCVKDAETGEMVPTENGTWYVIGDEKFYGFPKFKKYIDANPEVLELLKPTIFAYMKKKEAPEPDSFASEVKKEEAKTRKSRAKAE
jgi:recombination protein RecA